MFISYNKKMYNVNYVKEIRNNGNGTIDLLNYNDRIITIPIPYQEVTKAMINDKQIVIVDEEVPNTERSGK